MREWAVGWWSSPNRPHVARGAATMNAVTQPTEPPDVEALKAVALIPGLDAPALTAMVAMGPTGGGGSFTVDPERAEECIRALRGVVLDLMAAQAGLGFAAFPAPGRDEVSKNVAEQSGVMANRAAAFVDAWRKQLQQTADGLEQQLAAYRAADEANRARQA